MRVGNLDVTVSLRDNVWAGIASRTLVLTVGHAGAVVETEVTEDALQQLAEHIVKEARWAMERAQAT